MKICEVCETNYVIVKQRCRTCYEYLRRRGRDRPRKLADRQPELNYRRFLRSY